MPQYHPTMKKNIIVLLLFILPSCIAKAGKHWSLPYTGNIADQLELFFPESDKATGLAVLVLPGGGYHNLSYNEKHLTACWLQQQGVMAIALSYRMPTDDSMTPLNDAWSAMRYIREHSEEWKIDPHKVGVIGFSAGGHLAASLSVHNDSLTRPDFSILFYPVISCHVFTKSRTRLIGETFTKEQEDYFSTEDHINSLTPPTFFVMSSTDTNIVAAGAIKYIERLMLNHVYTEAHFFPEGKHGFCFKQEFPFYEDMTMLLARFLKHQAKRTDE